MMKMIQMLKPIKRNSAIAVSTLFQRLIWPSMLPLRSIAQQMHSGSTQPFS
ncbi:MAG TPA: hypothetical protein VE218_11180 [Acidobacteriaceae bacterium]|nr:hypothetical protein [Acidobacteriaceae bacterium]